MVFLQRLFPASLAAACLCSGAAPAFADGKGLVGTWQLVSNASPLIL